MGCLFSFLWRTGVGFEPTMELKDIPRPPNSASRDDRASVSINLRPEMKGPAN